MTGIAEFIAARLAEDSDLAAGGAIWTTRTAGTGIRSSVPYAWVITEGPDGQLHDPARVSRQAAALQAVLDEHQPESGICGTCRHFDFRYDYDPVRWPCPTVRAVASIWSDHPDYRAEWAA